MDYIKPYSFTSQLNLHQAFAAFNNHYGTETSQVLNNHHNETTYSDMNTFNNPNKTSCYLSSLNSTTSMSPQKVEQYDDYKDSSLSQYQGARKLQPVDLDKPFRSEKSSSLAQDPSEDRNLETIYERIKNLRSSLILDQLQKQPQQPAYKNPLQELQKQIDPPKYHQSKLFNINSEKSFIASPKYQSRDASAYKDIPKENLEPLLLTSLGYNSQQNYPLSQQKVSLRKPDKSTKEVIDVEDMIRREMESKYKSHIDALEKKSSQLERSMQIIEEMKSKFSMFEFTQNQNNDLQAKYNTLLERLDQYQSKANILSPLKHSQVVFLNEKEESMKSSSQGVAQLQQNPLEMSQNVEICRQNMIMKQQNEDLQEEIKRLRFNLHQKKSSSFARDDGSRTPTKSTSSLRNRTQSLIKGSLNQSSQNIRSLKKLASQKSQNKFHSRTSSNLQIPTQKTNGNVSELLRQIQKLEEENSYLRSSIRNLNPSKPLSKSTSVKCCCKDLKAIYDEKTKSLEEISEHWKQKTHLLVSKYYKSLQLMRDDQYTLKEQSATQLLSLKNFMEQIVGQVLQRQNEMSVYYEKTKQRQDQENKKLKQRIVNLRNISAGGGNAPLEKKNSKK